ncbi:hypothetical protein [Nostoc sp. NOS(2021)]|uniref:hypothetical protein n=1 Tax=Nostoc sp. NOS(2021) TaxID=2815407 RepID=UPI0025FB335C|nr:hypothetical protein [Nostoc sp. NOS(2021)]
MSDVVIVTQATPVYRMASQIASSRDSQRLQGSIPPARTAFPYNYYNNRTYALYRLTII